MLRAVPFDLDDTLVDYVSAPRHAPEELLVVGNSLDHDVLGGLAAGIDAILLDRHDAHAGEPVRRIRSLRELESLGE